MRILEGDYAVDRTSGFDGDSDIKRVTKILDEINTPEIVYWANSLGFRHLSYAKELRKYADLGTLVHSEIEDILTHVNSPFYFLKYETPGAYAFYTWLAFKRAQGIHLKTLDIEKSIIGKYFCGTMDAIMKLNDEVYLIDFKTSNVIGYKYYMQLCAYRYLLKLSGYPYEIDKLMILQVDKYDPDKFKEYIIDCKLEADKVDFLTNAFLELVLLSYQLDEIRGYKF